MRQAEVAIIGGGIIGLATAYRFLQRYPQKSLVLLEKEPDLAHHQTGHNSGVLHSGIYYKPDSLKAVNCRQGKQALQEFCDQEEIPYDLCGKVIVAAQESELTTLQALYERGQANGVRCEWIDRGRLQELEPHTAGIQAIHVPETGIIDFKQVSQRLAAKVREAGGTILTRARVTAIHQRSSRLILKSAAGEVEAEYLVNCAGLYSDRIAKMTGLDPGVQIVPFRGEYYDLKPEAQHLCRALIYPVPDPNFPFLGVHFTRKIHGGVECGPNAVLAFAREGYTHLDINLSELYESLTYSGLMKLALQYWQTGLGEMMRSWSKTAFVHALQRLVPEIRSQHLEPAPAGVRAQALRPDGTLVDDFLITESERIVNVCNAPSPAATAALNIGRLIVEKLVSRFQ